jgi:cytochrome b pre-mRNA-processing protein 3
MLPARLTRLFRSDPESAAAARLYESALRHSRTPEFFASWGVPDTLDGRFETLCLHVFLVLRRLRAEGAAGRGLAQAVTDAMVADMDRTLRELGVGDLGVGRRVRAMAEALLGRTAAYDAALDREDDAALAAALTRNLWGTLRAPAAPTPAALAAACSHLRAAEKALAGQDLAALRARGAAFPGPGRAA